MFKKNKDNLKKILLMITISVCVVLVFLFVNFCFERLFLYPKKNSDIVTEMAEKYQIEENLIYSVIKTESSFNKMAESESGAKGLMQLTYSTEKFIASELGAKDYNIFDERVNIEFGTFYLRYLIDKFTYLDTALYAYNGGEGRVNGWLKDSRYSLDGKRLIDVPIKETKEYVKKIEKSFEKYNKLYKSI